MTRSTGHLAGVGLVVALLAALTLAACGTRADLKGGSNGRLDWEIGIPF